MTTAGSRKLLALAQRIADTFPANVVEVVLTGSVSRGVADELSDIEMLCVTERQISLDEAFELVAAAGLEGLDSWGDPSTPTRRVFGYADGQPVETVWWWSDFANEHFDEGGSADAIANGIALRSCGLLAGWQARLRDYSDALATARIEEAAERWGGFAPAGLLTLLREGDRLALTEWLVESAQRVLAIVYALNRVHPPTTKRLTTRLETLPAGPDRTAERITAALLDPDPRRALLAMTELQFIAVNLAPSGPNVDRARVWLAEGVELLRRIPTS